MKKLVFVLLFFISLCTNVNASEIKPFVGLGYYVPTDLVFSDYVYAGSNINDVEYSMDSSYGLVAGLILSNRMKASFFYYSTEGKISGYTDKVDYDTFGISLDYIFLSLSDEYRKGLYVGIGARYDIFDSFDMIGDDTVLTYMVKLGYEYQIDKLLIDFGYCYNFSDEAESYVDSGPDTNEANYNGPSEIYISFSFIF